MEAELEYLGLSYVIRITVSSIILGCVRLAVHVREKEYLM